MTGLTPDVRERIRELDEECNRLAREVADIAAERTRLQTERQQLAGLLENAIDAVDDHAQRGWPEPPMPGDVPAAFIHWQAKRLREVRAARDHCQQDRNLWRERALLARREYHEERQLAQRCLRLIERLKADHMELQEALQAAQNWARQESYQSDDYTEGYPPKGTCTWCLSSPAEGCWDGCPGEVVAKALGDDHE